MTQRWIRRPEGSNWGDFGPDDQLGRLNLLTPEKVRKAVNEVREGKVFCLSLPLDYPGGNKLHPSRFPPEFQPIIRNEKPARNLPLGKFFPGKTDVVNDERVLFCSQYSTQWDGLFHIGSLFDADGDGVAEQVFYNGFKAGEHVTGPLEFLADGTERETGQSIGATRLGIENMAATGVQGCGVLVDLHAHYGRAFEAVGYDGLMTVLKADNVNVESGDMLCIYTGFADLVLEMARDPDPDALHGACTALDGRDAKLLQWITDRGVAVLIADNYAVERLPAREAATPCANLPLHEHCLFKLGIHLGELWHLGDLARWLRDHGRSRFLLTAPPLRLPGAAGSPVTPVATV